MYIGDGFVQSFTQPNNNKRDAESMRPGPASQRWNSAQRSETSPTAPSAFERYTQQLGLSIEDYASSTELREWCRENKQRCYIPEWLLKHWRIGVQDSHL